MRSKPLLVTSHLSSASCETQTAGNRQTGTSIGTNSQYLRFSPSDKNKSCSRSIDVSFKICDTYQQVLQQESVEDCRGCSSSTHMHVWYVVMLAYYDAIHTQLLIFYIKTLHWHYEMWSQFLLCSFRALTKVVNATWAELPGLRCCTDCSLLYYDDINSYFSIPDIPVQLELQLWLDFPQEQLNF